MEKTEISILLVISEFPFVSQFLQQQNRQNLSYFLCNHSEIYELK